MSMNTAIFLILLLPLAWLLIFVIRALMGGSFRAKDRAAHEGAMLTSQWQLKQQNALHRGGEEEKELWAEDEWGRKKKEEETGHVYPVHTTKEEHLKKVNKVGEEKEAHFPSSKTPPKK